MDAETEMAVKELLPAALLWRAEGAGMTFRPYTARSQHYDRATASPCALDLLSS